MQHEQENWALLEHILTAAVRDKRLEETLRFLLTPEEGEALPKRLILIQSLLRGQDSQRVIAEKTGISIAKITRGSNELKRINPNFKQWLSQKLEVTH